MSYEVPSNESRARKMQREIDTTRHLARFAISHAVNVDNSADGVGTVKNPTSVKHQLTLVPEIHYVGVEITWGSPTTNTNPLVLGDEVSGTGGWRGRLVHVISSTRGVFEPSTYPSVAFTNSDQTLTKVVGGWSAPYVSASGNYKNECIVIKSATAIVDTASGNPSIKTIYGASKDGQVVTLLPKDGKSLTLDVGDNLDLSTALVVSDNTIAIAQFHNRKIGVDVITDNKWKISVGSSGTSDINMIKTPCRVATVFNYSNLSLVGDTIDGVVVNLNDRVLLRAQTTASQNGIYYVSGSLGGGVISLSRATDFNEDSEVKAGVLVAIEEGTTYADKLFILTTNNPITVGTTSLNFAVVEGDFANRTLSNLTAPTSINANLIPSTDDARDMGDPVGTKWWKTIYARTFSLRTSGNESTISGDGTGNIINTKLNGQDFFNLSRTTTAGLQGVGTFEFYGRASSGFVGTQPISNLKLVATEVTTPADRDLARLSFDGLDSSFAQKTYAHIQTTAVVRTAGSEDGKMLFNVMNNGTSTEMLKLDGGTSLVTVNNAGLYVSGYTTLSTGALINSTGANITTTDNIFRLDVGGDSVLYIDTSASNKQLEFRSVENEVPIFILYRADTTPADGNTMGTIRFNGSDSDLNQTVYAQIDGIADDVTNTTEDGKLDFLVKQAGGASLVSMMTLTGGTGLVVTSNAAFAGSITSITSGTILLGDQTTDIITATATFNSGLKFQNDNSYDIGGSTTKLANLWIYNINFSSDTDFTVRKHSGTNDLDLGVPATTNAVDMYYNGTLNYSFGWTTFLIGDATDISVGTTTGTKIGTSTSQKLGFWGKTPITRPTVTGSRSGNAALADLLTELANAGLITDSTTA